MVTNFDADKITTKQLVVKNSCKILSTITISKAVTLSSTVAITGAVTMGSTLGVTGAVTLAAGLTVGTTLGVTGAVTLSSTLAVTGLITANGGITVPSGDTLNVIGTFQINSATISATATEINKLSGVVGGITEVIESDFVASGEGTYTATITIPAGAIVTDVRWMNSVLWDSATSAGLDVGDVADPNGYIAGVDLKTAPVADVNGAGGISSFLKDTGTGAYKGLTVSYPTGGTITAVVTAVGAGSAGRSKLIVILVNPFNVAPVKS